MKTILFSLIAYFLIINCFAQNNSLLILDQHASQIVGAQDLATLDKVLYTIENNILPDSLIFKPKKKFSSILYRLIKGVLIDEPIDELISTTQHEIFGHGARLREYGFYNNTYFLELGFPYSVGHGQTNSGNLQLGFHYPTLQQNIVGILGGVDAQQILAHTVESQVILKDTINYRDAILYLYSENVLSGYIWRTKLFKGNQNTGNDIKYYLEWENVVYPHYGLYYDKELNNLSQLTLINFLNPMQFYGIYTIAYNYIWKGEKTLNNIPMIRIANIKYLPMFNLSLSPFGYQYHLLNYIRYQHQLITGDFIFSNNNHSNGYGISLKSFNTISTNSFNFNIQLHLWMQPYLNIEDYHNPKSGTFPGIEVVTDISYHLPVLPNKTGIFVQTGYKTKGFITGEPIGENYILRFGLSLNI